MAQVLGVLAVILFLLSFQMKTRKNIIIVNVTSRFFYIVQYILLGAYEGAVLDFIGFVSSLIAKYKDEKIIKKYVIFIIAAINIVIITAGILLYENIFSLFAILAIGFEVMALWLTKEKNIRILSFISAPLWFVYNITNHAYGSAVGSILVMISIGIAMCRYDLK